MFGRKAAILCLSTLCILAGLCSAIALPQKDEQKRVEDTDEYAVYSALLNTKYLHEGVQRLVIAIDTTSTAKTTFIGYRTGLAPSGAKRPEVEPETSTDFDAKNKDTYPLASRFTLALPYVLVTEEELKMISREDAQGKLDMECWHRFYDKYPGARGIFAFSRVGFNSKKEQALV